MAEKTAQLNPADAPMFPPAAERLQAITEVVEADFAKRIGHEVKLPVVDATKFTKGQRVTYDWANATKSELNPNYTMAVVYPDQLGLWPEGISHEQRQLQNNLRATLEVDALAGKDSELAAGYVHRFEQDTAKLQAPIDKENPLTKAEATRRAILFAAEWINAVADNDPTTINALLGEIKEKMSLEHRIMLKLIAELPGFEMFRSIETMTDKTPDSADERKLNLGQIATIARTSRTNVLKLHQSEKKREVDQKIDPSAHVVEGALETGLKYLAEFAAAKIIASRIHTPLEKITGKLGGRLETYAVLLGEHKIIHYLGDGLLMTAEALGGGILDRFHIKLPPYFQEKASAALLTTLVKLVSPRIHWDKNAEELLHYYIYADYGKNHSEEFVGLHAPLEKYAAELIARHEDQKVIAARQPKRRRGSK